MSKISGREMAKSLNATVQRYFELGLLEGESCANIGTATAQLSRAKKNTTWEYSVSKGAPIVFKECTDPRDNEKFSPQIMVEKISVDTDAEFPYLEWVTVLVLKYKDRKRSCPRWHFDLGNAEQPGPRLHLQYGGHYHEENRDLDETLKIPRWSKFPLDTILLMEVVAANFFEKTWKAQLREDPSLTKYIKLSEGLCYDVFSKKLSSYLENIDGNQARTTFLGGCWNDNWA